MKLLVNQLAEQCTEYEWLPGQGTQVYFDKAKFAELIVKECVNAIQSDMDRETMNGTISLAKHAGMVSAKTVIKKHFGVE